MNKSFKRFISTMLVACMAMSMVASAAGTENEASEAETSISIIESSQNEEAGTRFEISRIDDMYYYFDATPTHVISIGYNTITSELEVYTHDIMTDVMFEGEIQEFDIGARSAAQMFEDVITSIENNSISLTPVENVQNDGIATYGPLENNITAKLEAKHGKPWARTIMISAGPNSSTGVLSGSLSYRITNSGVTIGALTPVASLARNLKISQAAIKALFGSKIGRDGAFILGVAATYSQATAMWTKTVHVNGVYQYYAGKDTTYPVLTFLDSCTPLEVGVTTAHPDFEDNNAMMQKGFDNFINFGR